MFHLNHFNFNNLPAGIIFGPVARIRLRPQSIRIIPVGLDIHRFIDDNVVINSEKFSPLINAVNRRVANVVIECSFSRNAKQPLAEDSSFQALKSLGGVGCFGTKNASIFFFLFNYTVKSIFWISLNFSLIFTV